MKEKLVFHIGTIGGFYSEYNNMVLAMLYCRLHGIDFELYSKDANFGQGRGWADFFEPFCKEQSWWGFHYINKRYSDPEGWKHRLLLRIYRTLHPNVFLTQDLWDDIRSIDRELTRTELMSSSRQIINETYRFNERTRAEVAELMQRIDIKGPYIGFHIRGGDKTTEHDIIGVGQYMAAAERLSDIRTAFVYTDNYDFITALRQKYPEWTIHTLTEEDEHGYFHLEFIKLTPAQQRNKLLKMFASMEYLRKSEYAICTYSSNPGMFLGMDIGDRAKGVDFDEWRIW